MDDTAEVNASETSILRWAMEIGQIDIHFEVSRMSSYMASPRIGHFEQVLHIFGYLQNVPKLTLAMDPLMPNVSEDNLLKQTGMIFTEMLKRRFL